MALSLTYTSLVAMLQAWLADTGTDFSNQVDNIIGLGELRLQRDLDLEVFESESSSTFPVNDPAVTKPDNIVALRSFLYTDGDDEVVHLTRRSVDYIRDYNQGTNVTGDPLYYAELNETQWIVAPVPATDHTYTVRYIQRPSGLSSSTATTWLSDNAPDALFYACLLEAETFNKNDDDQARFSNIRTHYDNEILPRAQRELQRMMKADYSPIKSTPPVTPVG